MASCLAHARRKFDALARDGERSAIAALLRMVGLAPVTCENPLKAAAAGEQKDQRRARDAVDLQAFGGDSFHEARSCDGRLGLARTASGGELLLIPRRPASTTKRLRAYRYCRLGNRLIVGAKAVCISDALMGQGMDQQADIRNVARVGRLLRLRLVQHLPSGRWHARRCRVARADVGQPLTEAATRCVSNNAHPNSAHSARSLSNCPRT